jgi:hypothetical protein
MESSLGLMSLTFYKQPLRLQIPKAQKTLKSSISFCVFGIEQVKTAQKMLVKLTPGLFYGTFYELFCMKVFFEGY